MMTAAGTFWRGHHRPPDEGPELPICPNGGRGPGLDLAVIRIVSTLDCEK